MPDKVWQDTHWCLVTVTVYIATACEDNQPRAGFPVTRFPVVNWVTVTVTLGLKMFAQFIIFTLLLFVSTAVHYVACETFIIIPTENSTLCPESEICYTLNEYASMNSNLSSNLDTITLELQPGTHTLDVPLAVRNISSFTMRGNNATLECKQRFNVTRAESVTL